MSITLMQKKKCKGWRNIMENKKINNDMLRVMFKSIRKAEDKNIKTQKYDNKKMIKMIESYIEKKVREEMAENEN